MAIFEILKEVEYRLDRIRLYGETDFKDWADWLDKQRIELLCVEDDIHNECYSSECVSEIVAEETGVLRAEIDVLKEKISELESIDASTYKKPRLPDHGLTPEQARSKFRVVRGL